jgi:hypothetical protein
MAQTGLFNSIGQAVPIPLHMPPRWQLAFDLSPLLAESWSGLYGAQRTEGFTHHASRFTFHISFLIALLFVVPPWAKADQVEMQNGDRYVGNVLSLSADTLVLQNEMLGTVQLPRSKVAHIGLSSAPGTSAAPRPVSAPSKAPVRSAAGAVVDTNSAVALRQLGAHTNLIRQIQKQFLADAGPEANQKFDELLNGLLSGRLTMGDLRAQAQSAANQLRELKRQGGEDAGFAVDTYLTILDHFLKEGPTTGSVTNVLVPSATTKEAPLQPQD